MFLRSIHGILLVALLLEICFYRNCNKVVSSLMTVVEPTALWVVDC